MVRKQTYIEPAQDRKIKRIAAQRHCTEAEVIRTALSELADPDGDIEELFAAGLLVDKSEFRGPEGKDLEELEARLDAWWASRTEPVGLSQAILDERDESPR